MNSRIAITHIGLCTPLGNLPEEVLPRLISGDISAMQWRNNLLFDAPTLVGCVDDKRLIEIADHLSLFACRNNRLLNTAAQQLVPAIEQAKQRFGSHRIGVVLGTSTSGISKGEAALKYQLEHGHFPPSYHYSQQELGSPSDYLKQLFELSGPCYTVSTACSSSAKVFASAQRLLNANMCDMVIVGGVDSLCQLTVNGFAALESVSKGHCNPFSRHRDGINIGEGAALFTLERGQSDVMLAGIGESADAHHISAPHPQGLGAIAAMQQALAEANIAAEKIDYLNLHGTATPKNDAMESRAVTAVFSHSSPACSSTKPLTGHTLGAAGAIEAAFCYLLLSPLNHDKRLPPHIWDGQQDTNDPNIALVSANNNTGLSQLNFIMSNSFAFGGSNASLIFVERMPSSMSIVTATPAMLAQDISTFIPHRSPMILIDNVLEHRPDCLITATHISPNSAYFDAQLNGVPNYVGIEYMAQSIAALAGVEALLCDDTIRVGFLLGTRKLQMHIDTFTLGESYRTQVTRLYQEESGLAVFDCQIYHHQTLVAAANVNVFQPQDTQAYIDESQADG